MIVILFSTLYTLNSFSQPIDAISKEMVDYELSGGRWQGGESPCLAPHRFKLIKATHQILGDSSLLQPQYLLPKGSEVTITSSKVSAMNSVDVSFSYVVLIEGKKEKIQDSLTYILNKGTRLKKLGTASIYIEPKYFVMREECIADVATTK